MTNIIVKTIPKNKEGEATSELAGKVKITSDYQSLLNNTFDSCGSAYVLSAEATVAMTLKLVGDLTAELKQHKKDVEDFIGKTYIPEFGLTEYPLERKYETNVVQGVGIALNHNLYSLTPEVSVYSALILEPIDASKYSVYYNTPTTLTFISNITDDVIIYVSSKVN